MKQALYFEKLDGLKVSCNLCPHRCKLSEGQTGICRVRTNAGGTLQSDNYAKVCSTRFDPIEKKPLYHYYPGSLIYSVGSLGCNLHCKFCQNWEISQTCVEDYPYASHASPDDIVKDASGHHDNIGIAYTYNEPTVWYEFMLDIARLACEKGLKNVVVTNGFIEKQPLQQLIPLIDAFNVDLKAFTEDFYKKVSFASLKPVLDSIKLIKKEGKHLEITNLVITGLNDDENDFHSMVSWIADETGRDTPFHLSRYFPVYKLENKQTSSETLLRFYEIAKQSLDYVYIGNMHSEQGQDTFCPGCGIRAINRRGYSIINPGLDKEGKCKYCGTKILAYV